MMYGYGSQWGILGWVVIGLLLLLFWGGIVAVVVTLVTGRTRGELPDARGHEEAERILNERFARGEIDEQELSARRAALRRSE
jgi:putative membrane protein